MTDDNDNATPSVQTSYRWRCQTCVEAISIAYSYCPWCGTEQSRERTEQE